MTALRVAFDMDGTLADLLSAYAEVERALFGETDADQDEPAPEVREVEQIAEAKTDAVNTDKRVTETAERLLRVRKGKMHRDRVWQTVEATPNFWTTLKPIEPGVVKRLFDLSEVHGWEVFFITQRPETAGATVQRQTHQWLVEQGFKTPSVIPLSGGRGKAASALRLDFLVDDSPQNCVDVLSDSSTRAILLIDRDDPLAASSARRLGIGVAHSVSEVLDLLVQATDARANPTLFEKLRRMVGWK